MKVIIGTKNTNTTIPKLLKIPSVCLKNVRTSNLYRMTVAIDKISVFTKSATNLTSHFLFFIFNIQIEVSVETSKENTKIMINTTFNSIPPISTLLLDINYFDILPNIPA